MARVSLILPVTSKSALLGERIEALRRSLAGAGHTLEIVAVADPRDPDVLDGLGPTVLGLVSERPGKAASAFRGLREASGDLLVILDLEKGYAPEDPVRVLDPLIRDEADLVVASTRRGPKSGTDLPLTDRRPRLSRWIDALARPLVGISDPSSGLVAVTRASYEARDREPSTLGSRFVLELLVGAEGRRVELPLPREMSTRPVVLHPNDLRLIKRLADERFGNLSRLFQFCVVGASGMVIDLSSYALFQLLLSRTPLAGVKTHSLISGQSLDLAVAGALAIALALVWNFSLNRRLTFNDARQGSIPRQFVTYALSNAIGIALSFSVRLILPSRFAFFERHKLAAAVVGIVAATGISFSMSRWVVFGRRPRTQGRQPHTPCQKTSLAERA
jgi:dolichol-phosphate mannosyltransferase